MGRLRVGDSPEDPKGVFLMKVPEFDPTKYLLGKLELQ